jgi:predicted Fe-Mo cluster-binding NifX family protein
MTKKLAKKRGLAAMKVAISASGSGTEAQVDPRFGRCVCFVIYDTEAQTFETVPNSAASAAGGSGVQAAQTVVDKGVSVVLTGQIGPHAFQVLEAAGVKCYTGAGGTVGQCIADYQAGKLSLAGGPTRPVQAGRGPGSGMGDGKRGMGRGMGRGGRMF